MKEIVQFIKRGLEEPINQTISDLDAILDSLATQSIETSAIQVDNGDLLFLVEFENTTKKIGYHHFFR